MAVARRARPILVLILLVSLASLAYKAPGQNQGMDIVHKFFTPPSPVLTPSDALKSFRIAPGFRIELVASEPLVQDPVAMCFDANGRLWVCEMRGFMPNLDGKGEKEPVGTIAVLEDTNNDGRMDKRRGRIKAGRIDFDAVQANLTGQDIELRGGAADEAPDAYKRLDAVLAAHGDTVEILHRLTPIGVAMAPADTFDPYKD